MTMVDEIETVPGLSVQLYRALLNMARSIESLEFEREAKTERIKRLEHDVSHLSGLISRVEALESPRAEPPQATTWPAPDCAAVAGETLPVVECSACYDPAVAVAIRMEGNDGAIDKIRQYCEHHARDNADWIVITGEPARAILHAIAREAARVRQGGAK